MMEACLKQQKTHSCSLNGLRCKVCKLKHVHNCLSRILEFLKDYLPLANSHSNEFITNNTWENFLPLNIRNELSSMSDENLIDLSSYHKFVFTNRTTQHQQEKQEEVTENTKEILPSTGKDFCKSCCKNNPTADCEDDCCEEDSSNGTKFEKHSCITGEKDPGTTLHENGTDFPIFSCPYFEQAPKVNKKHKLIRGYPPNWIHRDLASFLQDAESNTLEKLNLALSLKDFYSKLSVSVDEDKIFIPHIMNQKKSHEVDVMGEVCSQLAKHCGIDLVVDMGSGKGYLSTQLALQYGLVVIGIDAMSVNTEGAHKRAVKLVKHWNGLVRNATEDKIRGYKVKRSKKLKKKLKMEAVKSLKETNTSSIRDKTQDTDVDLYEELPDFQNLFENSDNCVDNVLSDKNNGRIIAKHGETDMLPYDKQIDQCSENNVYEKEMKDDIIWSDCSEINTQNSYSEHSVNNIISSSELNASDLTIQDITSDRSSKFNLTTRQHEQNSEPGSDKIKSVKGYKNVIPLTMFVNSDLNLYDIVNMAFEESSHSCTKKCTLDHGLMLTGLHTCGALGSSILQLFVNNPQARILCNVACCYHLMEEEFVCSPFDDGEGTNDEEPGFPLSKYLKDQKVGLGRVARNFASQSLIRMAKENQLKSKAFPRSLLQKIILDVIGYTKEDWKGLRKLDQKCENMFQYVCKAFSKFGLPTEKLTPELVSEYEEKYKEEERKLAIFHNLKSMIAPCIEAVVILDRICYLLEQKNVADVDLVQLFDPLISPRCYGIIAYKKENSEI